MSELHQSQSLPALPPRVRAIIMAARRVDRWCLDVGDTPEDYDRQMNALLALRTALENFDAKP